MLRRQGVDPGEFRFPLPDEAFRWWHDKFERLLHHEEDVLGTWTGFFYVVQAAFIAAIVAGILAQGLDLGQKTLLVSLVCLLASFLSLSMFAVLGRTAVAVSWWRHSLLLLEATADFPAARDGAGTWSPAKPVTSFERHFEFRRGGRARSEFLTPHWNISTMSYRITWAWLVAGFAANFVAPWLLDLANGIH